MREQPLPRPPRPHANEPEILLDRAEGDNPRLRALLHELELWLAQARPQSLKDRDGFRALYGSPGSEAQDPWTVFD